MELNLKIFDKEILQNKFNNNQRQCAKALRISAEFLNKVIKEKTKAGALFLGRLKIYCDNNDLDFDEFIIIK